MGVPGAVAIHRLSRAFCRAELRVDPGPVPRRAAAPARTVASMTAPQDPSNADPASGAGNDTADDEVIDGEIVEAEHRDADLGQAADADADTMDADADADAVDAGASAVSEDVPAGTSPDPVAVPDAPVAPVAGTDDTVITAGAAPGPVFDYTDDGVPTLDFVRDKIEGRWGTAMGSTELAQASQAGRQQQDAAAERDRRAKEKLAELRRQVDGGQSES